MIIIILFNKKRKLPPESSRFAQTYHYIYDESTESCLMINTDSDNDDEYDDDSPDRR